MERELWPPLDHLVMGMGETMRLADVTFQPPLIALVFLWAAIHDRPVSWACDEANWCTTTLRPFTIPSESTMSRRLRRLDMAIFMRVLIERARRTGDPHLTAVIDGKPLPILIYGAWAAVPKTHPGPFEWSMTGLASGSG